MKNSNILPEVYNVTKPHGVKRLVLAISIIFTSFYNFIIANIIQMVFQGTSEMTNDKLKLFAICIITVILGSIFSYAIKVLSAKNSLGVEKKLKEKLLLKLNNVNYLKVQSLDDGEWMTIADSDINRVSVFYQRCVINTITGVLGFCLAILFGLGSSWQLTILIMTFATISALLPKLIEKQLVKNINNAQEIQESIRQSILVTSNKIPLIKLTRSYKTLEDRFSKQTDSYAQENINQARMTSFLAAISTLITYFSMAIWIFTGVYFISIGTMTIGGLFGFMSLSSSFNWPLYIAPILQKEFLLAEVSYSRITEFLLKEEVNNNFFTESLKIDNLSDEAIKVNNLSFSYNFNVDDDKQQLSPILKYSDFNIYKNQKVLLEGDSGAGKTTLMKLLLGLYQPSTGKISLSLNSNNKIPFSYVPQNNNLFTGTIRENLIIGNPKATDDEMIKALNNSGILNLIQDLDEGLDTKIGSGYRVLSGGQMQGMCLARAFLSDSDIIMIDEGTSAIDPINKELVIRSLKQINKTVILISHDLTTQEIVDKKIRLINV